MNKPTDTIKPHDEGERSLRDVTCSPKWVHWDRGWGWNLTLSHGIRITVSKGMSRGDGFRWSGLGISSKRQYENEEDAKKAAELNIRHILTKCLDSLENTQGEAQPPKTT